MPDRTNTLDPAAALQRLKEAGDSVPKLLEAVKDASFLEDIPSPERQFYRASKIKLKRALLRASAEKAKTSAFSESDIDVDKFLKYSEKFQKLCDEYEKLKWRIVKMPGGATRKADSYYTLHGLMKQALEGDVDQDCPMFAENGNIDFHARFAWDAWSLAKGLPTDEAKQKFVTEFFKFPSNALYSDTRGQLIKSF